jgi:hypothetical protein
MTLIRVEATYVGMPQEEVENAIVTAAGGTEPASRHHCYMAGTCSLAWYYRDQDAAGIARELISDLVGVTVS